MRAAHAARPFQGTERFEIIRLLGRGAAGQVYEAYDRLRKVRVALKTLTELDPEVRYRFKREFRALGNVHAEHLVELYELSAESDPWFFTMELIEGVDFMTYLRGSRDAKESGPQLRHQGRAGEEARLRGAFAQLCEGLEALHTRGLLHRDVKPSNVLVSESGRVVLVDFGIVAELRVVANSNDDLTALVGTPDYMAPEQCCGESVSPATDWYAVGVMLFEALTGTLPFDQSERDVVAAKLADAAPRVRERVPDAPAELDALCARLLAMDPADRPSFAEIVGCLRGEAGNERDQDAELRAPVFVGRERELEGLSRALADVKPSEPVFLHVPGTSGMGKSTLLGHFFATLVQQGKARVFQGRCCERESVPFKALDDVIDALAVQLKALDEQDFPAVEAEGAAALVHIFPVLAQVPALVAAAEAGGSTLSTSARVLRTRALFALRSLLGSLARERPVVLAIDDAQWGDEDSAALLQDLTAPPHPPGVLIVLAYRREWVGRSPLLRARAEHSGVKVRLHTVAVDPLPDDRAAALAAHWLERAPGDPAVRAIVSEAQGSPFLLTEFARHVRAAGIPARGLQLSEVLHARFAELDDAPRRLLEALAIAARPLDPLLAARAALLGHEEGAAAVRALRKAHLVRESDARPGELRIETFHDRVRETMASAMSEEHVRAQHERFVAALTATDSKDVEALYQHCRGAGQNERAVEYAALAAAEAVRSLAFVRAAELFDAALSLAPAHHPHAQKWRVARADVLAYAGRRADAGDAYVQAAQASPDVHAGPFLECAAIEQYLAGGKPDIGLAIAERTLQKVGMPLAATRNAALLSMVRRMAWLRIRGVGFRERPEHAIARAQLAQIDAAHSVARGLSIHDPIRGGEMFLRTVGLALKTGEIKRISVALSCFSTMTGIEGPSAYADMLLSLATELALRSEDLHTLAVASLNHGCIHALCGHWRSALVELERTDALFQELRGVETADHHNTRSMLLFVRFWLGRMREVGERVPFAVADAAQRGDAYSKGLLTTSKASLCWLAFDQPELHAELSRTGITSERRGNTLCIEHVAGMVNLVDNALYVQEPELAEARLAETLPDARASLMLRMVITRTQVADAQARTALMLACKGKDAQTNRRRALKEARALSRMPLPWPRATATLLRAGEADAAGRAEDAVALYRRAALELEAADMMLCATVARLRLGQWLGGDEGRSLRTSAQAWLREQGIVAPERFAMMMAPTSRT